MLHKQKYLCHILNISWPVVITNELNKHLCLRKSLNVNGLELVTQKWKLNPLKKMYYIEICRKRGLPIRRWKSTIHKQLAKINKIWRIVKQVSVNTIQWQIFVPIGITGTTINPSSWELNAQPAVTWYVAIHRFPDWEVNDKP